MTTGSRAKRSTIIGLGLLALLLLVLLCVWFHAGRIEDDLHGDVAAAVGAAGVSGVDVSLDGRDVTLSGAVAAADADTAVAAAEGVDGVRVVHDEFATPAGGAGDGSTTGADEARAALADLTDIAFARGSADLTTESQQRLDAAASALNAAFADDPNVTVTIEGHTNPGSAAQQPSLRQLSQERAQAVVDYLARQGVEPGRLTAVGRGGDDPVVAQPQTEADKDANRRVVFVVVEG